MKILSRSLGISACSIAVLSLAMMGLTPKAQAQQAQQPQSIFLEGDMVRGNTGKGQTGPTCVLNSRFKHNENAVFLGRVGLAIYQYFAADSGALGDGV